MTAATGRRETCVRRMHPCARLFLITAVDRLGLHLDCHCPDLLATPARLLAQSACSALQPVDVTLCLVFGILV